MSRPRTATKQVALGFRVHSGWAALVAVSGPSEAPELVLRRRVQTADPAISGSKQPYHAAAPMAFAQAKAFIARCAASTRRLTRAVIRDAVAELTSAGFTASGSCVLVGSGRPMPELAKILASHTLIHSAEGTFYREAVAEASTACGLPLLCVNERELTSDAHAALGIPPSEIDRRITQMGRAVGPPWRQDEKLSALAAWLALVTHADDPN